MDFAWESTISNCSSASHDVSKRNRTDAQRINSEEIGKAYTEWGWQGDAAVLDAFASVKKAEDVAAIKAVITALYRPWLENAAIAMQKVVYSGHPSQTYRVEPLSEPGNGVCILFCDGLRYDIGRRLATVLETSEMTCTVEAHLVALPSVTPTAKPAISPVSEMLSGKASQGLEPVVTASGSKVTVEVLRKLLTQNGYQVLKGEDLGDPSGRAWTEMGDIDSYGHQYDWKLSHHLIGEIHALERRIETLLNWGWKQVLVVTDHGWLLLPGGLPKAELPEHLTAIRKGTLCSAKENRMLIRRQCHGTGTTTCVLLWLLASVAMRQEKNMNMED